LIIPILTLLVLKGGEETKMDRARLTFPCLTYKDYPCPSEVGSYTKAQFSSNKEMEKACRQNVLAMNTLSYNNINKCHTLTAEYFSFLVKERGFKGYTPIHFLLYHER
jgi:hypothetical protein